MVEATQLEVNRIIELVIGQRIRSADDLLIDGYGAESVDIVNIVTALENKFRTHVSESSLPALKTPRDFLEYIQTEQTQ